MLDFSRLSDEQRRVVLTGDGPLLVVAGPGSGKTTTIAARVAYLVDARQVGPGSVLAVTFTRAAAHALRRRLVTMLGERGEAVDVTTLHSFGLRVVRQWSRHFGFAPGAPLRVCGAACTQALVLEAARAMGVDADRTPVGRLSQRLEHYRLRIAGSAVPAVGAAAVPGGLDGPDQTLASLAGVYEALLVQRRLVDYAAMLAWPVHLFRAAPAVLRLCQDAYRAILADEFQDLCAVQYVLLCRLAERHRNLAVVGDPAQSVYGWRGADAGLFRRFLRDFPDTQVHHLEQNFRSTGSIVTLANALGADLGMPRRLWTVNPPGPRALLYAALDEADEAAFVAAEIARLAAARVVQHLGEIAVLYRTNQQARGLQQALEGRGLRCRLQGRNDPAAEAEEAPDVEGRRNGTVAGHGHAGAGTPAALRLPGLSAGVPPGLPGAQGAQGGQGAQAGQDQASGVLLTTIHAAKGAEWRVVFVVGVEEGLLPHARTLQAPLAEPGGSGPSELPAGDDAGWTPRETASGAAASDGHGLAEELRVAYVAVTRPRERLYLSYCRRRSDDPRGSREPSRFLRRLPSEVLAAVPPASVAAVPGAAPFGTPAAAPGQAA